MSPKLRTWIFIGIGVALAIAIGIDLADEDYSIAAVAAVAAICLGMAKASSEPIDAWLLGVSLIGYLVGNRGFAQLQPIGRLPILPAEGVLAVCLALLAVRVVFRQTNGFRPDKLNCALLAWILIATLQMPWAMKQFGVMALRDYATVYYALFFFVAQDLARRPASARLLRACLTIGFVFLVPVVISIIISPDYLTDHLIFKGVPLIYHKSDLIATSLAAGFFWLWTRWEKSNNRVWILASAACILLIGAMASPRAGMVSVAVTTLLWLLTGRWRIAVAEVAFVSVAAALAMVYVVASGKDIKTSAPYSAYEHAMSIFDPEGNGTYVNEQSGELGGNNRFRLIWWRDVAEETMENAPLMGLGFGADLTTRFLADNNLLSDESFAARSPHSIIVDMLGRTGLIGAAAWLCVMATTFGLVWKLIRQGDPDGMGLASIASVTLLSACFGVVLEGPMAAVIYWTALGLASAALKPNTKATTEETEESHVANADALDTQSSIR